jgi:hypothetical protein
MLFSAATTVKRVLGGCDALADAAAINRMAERTLPGPQELTATRLGGIVQQQILQHRVPP